MGVWLVTADVLATSRFALSPLTETVNALGLLATGDPRPADRSWYTEHAGAFRRRVAADPFAIDLLGTVLGRGWLPDFMVRPPMGREPDISDELARVRATEPEVALADLAVPLHGSPLPPGVLVPDPAAAVADLLGWVWQHTLAADWARRRRLLQSDITARSSRIATYGWADALADLAPKVRWLGDGQLQINSGVRPPRDLTGAELVLVPTTSGQGWVTWDLPHRYGLVYPAAGTLVDPASRGAPTALRRLLGPSRADLLTRLDHPATTTQLAAGTGLALGTVGHHLRVLYDSHLVHRRRAGAQVLYYRSDLGEHLVHPEP